MRIPQLGDVRRCFVPFQDLLGMDCLCLHVPVSLVGTDCHPKRITPVESRQNVEWVFQTAGGE